MIFFLFYKDAISTIESEPRSILAIDSYFMELELRINFKGKKSFNVIGGEHKKLLTMPMKRKSMFLQSFKVELLKLHETGKLGRILGRVGTYQLPKEVSEDTSWSGLSFTSTFTCFIGYVIFMLIGIGILSWEVYRSKKS